MKIEELKNESVDETVTMMLELWPDAIWEDEVNFCQDVLRGNKYHFYLLKDDKRYVGFILLSLRHEHVEGAESSPVAYVEGIYIRDGYKRKGLGHMLIQKAEEWARTKGCSQLGSDVEIGNDRSIAFHEKMGFNEENRIVCYMKNVK